MILLFSGFILLESFFYILQKKSDLILSKKDFIPTIKKSLIDKFHSYDSELGWVNQKNTIRYEVSQENKIKYTYNNKGARSIGDLDAKKSIISSYGDSFCQGRESNDLKTWQFFLSKKLNTNVTNFGVGNYGFDQSLLRLKREYENNKTKYVIIAITPYTITRITSVWKHFSEFNNVLATKPRFILLNNKLELLQNFIQKKDQLLNMKIHKKFMLDNDEHVEYLKRHIYSFPFIISFFKSPRPVLKTLLKKSISFTKRINSKIITNYLRLKYYDDEINYRKNLYQNHKKLLTLMIDDFVDFSKKKKFIPILLVLPSFEDVKYIQNTKDNYYRNYFKTVNSDYKFWDFSENLINENEVEKFFIDDIWGGHYNSHGNRRVAKFIERKIYENKIII